MEHLSTNESETAAIAANLASGLTCDDNTGKIFCLYGDLGAGKSSFARAFIQTLTNKDEDVPSPTFTLIQEYDTSKGMLYHFDLYRLEHPDEIIELGWEDIITQGIILVEWPERLGAYLPKNRTDIHIETTGTTSRKITIHDQTG